LNKFGNGLDNVMVCRHGRHPAFHIGKGTGADFRNQPDADASNDTGASCDPATTGLPASLRAVLVRHPELSKLIESWPNLSLPMRIGIIAMVESSEKDR
jgi:hypothetical protein